MGHALPFAHGRSQLFLQGSQLHSRLGPSGRQGLNAGDELLPRQGEVSRIHATDGRSTVDHSPFLHVETQYNALRLGRDDRFFSFKGAGSVKRLFALASSRHAHQCQGREEGKISLHINRYKWSCDSVAVVRGRKK